MTVFGDLVLCPCDTLAAQWLGGFKEGVSFALKGCRTCTSSMKIKFFAEHFKHRDASEHLEHVAALNAMKTPKAFKYWRLHLVHLSTVGRKWPQSIARHWR